MSKKKTESVGASENAPAEIKSYRITIRNAFVNCDCSIEAESAEAALAIVKANLTANVAAA